MASQTFFERPAHKHHIAMTFLVAVLLVVFALASFLQENLDSSSHVLISGRPLQYIAPGSADFSTKAGIMARISNLASRPLSTTEKSMLLQNIYGDHLRSYGFTSEEMNSVLLALNNQ